MNDDPQKPMPDHEIDGISELDNLLPRWWVWLFWLCIIWGALYLVHFHVLKMGPLAGEVYQSEVARHQEQAALAAEAAASAVPPEPSTDAAVLSRGQAVFGANCMVCHGPQGQGLIGPNLTDEFWIHGPLFADTLRTIREGVPAKGMITWKNVLRPDDIKAVASYVFTLRGSNPPNPRAPEGQKAAM